MYRLCRDSGESQLLFDTESVVVVDMDSVTSDCTLVFFVNGKKVVEEHVDPEWTLLTYLREKLQLPGTKMGCAEGGCGACTVMVSRMDPQCKKIKHFSVNACLTPIGSVHGMSVTTVEGIGSTKTRLHPVQERLAKSHGSQCGFCTPGIVMSTYTLLRNTPKPSMEQIEDYLVGNLCRCTGYRPIIEGLRTFTEANSSVKGCGRTDCCQLKSNSTGNADINGCDEGKNQLYNGCSNHNENIEDQMELNIADHLKDAKIKNETDSGKRTVLFDPKEFTPFDPTQEVIFPPELKLNPEILTQSLVFKNDRTTFYRISSLKKLIYLKNLYPSSKIVVGNTEIGVETKFKNLHFPVIINPVGIPELTNLELKEEFVEVGAGLPLSEVESEFKGLVKQLPRHKSRTLESLLHMFKWFAGRQIRNVAGLGGNIMTGSPISDLIPVLIAAGSKLVFQNIYGRREITLDENFYNGYRRNISRPDDVLVTVKIPFTSENEFIKSYKQARRRDDDIAIVNSGMKVVLDLNNFTVVSAKLVFGGMGPTAVVAKETMKKIVGCKWNKELLEMATTSLLEELKLETSAPGGMAEYRNILSCSFFFKFYLAVCHELSLINSDLYTLEEEEQEAIKTYECPPTKSTQLFQKIPENQEVIDPIGRPIPHVSSAKQTCGEATYMDDIPHFKNELFGAFVLSKRAKAKILDINVSDALDVKGVRSFISAKDLPGEGNKTGVIVQDEEVFAQDEVKCVGQIIGLIVANDQETAQRSAKKVEVTYEDLPNPVFTIEEAIEANSVWDPLLIESGDVEEGLRSSQITLEGEVRLGGQEHFYLETNVHIAVPREDDEIELWTSSQSLSEVQLLLGRALGIPSNRITCKVKRIGGGFGGKQSRATTVVIPVAAAAVKTRHPVRVVLDRDEDMLITGGRHPFLGQWKVGFNKDGKLKALDVQLYSNAGWSYDLSEPVMLKAVFNINNAYKIDNLRVKGQCCRTNLPSNTAFRGFGNPQTIFVMENIISSIADYLKADPAKVRERNMYGNEIYTTHYGQEIKECLVRQCWDQVLSTGDYRQREKKVQEYNRTHKLRKRGISAIPLKFGVGFEIKFLNQAGALIMVYQDGSVLLSHGGMEMGQGLHTKMIQIASKSLQIPMENIYISETSTDKVPNTSPSAASVSSDLNGMAVLDACEKILDRLKPFKEKMPNSTWKEWVSAAYFSRVSLSASGFYCTPNLIEFDFKDPKPSRPFNYFCFGAAIAEVEIDCLTGDHTVLRSDIVMDVGKSLNPAIDIGQIEGAFLQGYGLLTLEQLLYTPSGELITKGPGTYKIPSIKDIPREFNVTLLRESKNERAVFSSKAVGEPPLLAAVSVFMAIKEAVKSSRGNSSFRLDSPATAERIRLACQDWITDQIPTDAAKNSKRWAMEV